MFNLLLGHPTLVGKTLSFTHELSFLSFYQSTVLSSHAVDGHKMYYGGLIVGKASTIGIEISSTPSLIFTGGQKVRNLPSFQHQSNLSCLHLKTQQDI